MAYIACFYTANPTHGTAMAVKMFDKLVEAGWLPIVPHTNLLIDLLSPRTADFWYSFDRGQLRRCDALFVCDDMRTQKSQGVKDEIAYANRLCIPVFYEVVEAKDRYAL